MSTLIKNDAGKVRMTLVPPIVKRAIATVMTLGVEKYSEDGWMNCPPDELWRYRDAMERHWNSYLEGEWLDQESGKPHLWHAATNVAFLIYLEDYYATKPSDLTYP